MTISMLGIDMAKNTFQLHGADNLTPISWCRLYRVSSNFTGRYIAGCRIKYEPYPGVRNSRSTISHLVSGYWLSMMSTVIVTARAWVR